MAVIKKLALVVVTLAFFESAKCDEGSLISASGEKPTVDSENGTGKFCQYGNGYLPIEIFESFVGWQCSIETFNDKNLSKLNLYVCSEKLKERYYNVPCFKNNGKFISFKLKYHEIVEKILEIYQSTELSNKMIGCYLAVITDCESGNVDINRRGYGTRVWVPNSNVTTCDIATRSKFHIGMLSISLLIGFPSAFILIYYCWKVDNAIIASYHRNLIIALVFRTLFTLLIHTEVILEMTNFSAVLLNNGSGCRFLASMDTIMNNLVWSFWISHALYLHKYAKSDFNEEPKILLYNIVNSGVAITFAIIWIIVMATAHNSNCWLGTRTWIQWINDPLRIIYVIADLALISDVVRMLLTKLKAVHDDTARIIRRFSLYHFIVFPWFLLQFSLNAGQPESDECEEPFYYTLYFIDGLQCALVCLFFLCFDFRVRNFIKEMLGLRSSESKKPSREMQITTIDSTQPTNQNRQFGDTENREDIQYSSVVHPDQFQKIIELRKRMNLSMKSSVTINEGDVFLNCGSDVGERKISLISEYYDTESLNQFHDILDSQSSLNVFHDVNEYLDPNDKILQDKNFQAKLIGEKNNLQQAEKLQGSIKEPPKTGYQSKYLIQDSDESTSSESEDSVIEVPTCRKPINNRISFFSETETDSSKIQPIPEETELEAENSFNKTLNLLAYDNKHVENWIKDHEFDNYSEQPSETKDDRLKAACEDFVDVELRNSDESYETSDTGSNGFQNSRTRNPFIASKPKIQIVTPLGKTYSEPDEESLQNVMEVDKDHEIDENAKNHLSDYETHTENTMESPEPLPDLSTESPKSPNMPDSESEVEKPKWVTFEGPKPISDLSLKSTEEILIDSKEVLTDSDSDSPKISPPHLDSNSEYENHERSSLQDSELLPGLTSEISNIENVSTESDSDLKREKAKRSSFKDSESLLESDSEFEIPEHNLQQDSELLPGSTSKISKWDTLEGLPSFLDSNSEFEVSEQTPQQNSELLPGLTPQIFNSDNVLTDSNSEFESGNAKRISVKASPFFLDSNSETEIPEQTFVQDFELVPGLTPKISKWDTLEGSQFLVDSNSEFEIPEQNSELLPGLTSHSPDSENVLTDSDSEFEMKKPKPVISEDSKNVLDINAKASNSSSTDSDSEFEIENRKRTLFESSQLDDSETNDSALNPNNKKVLVVPKSLQEEFDNEIESEYPEDNKSLDEMNDQKSVNFQNSSSDREDSDDLTPIVNNYYETLHRNTNPFFEQIRNPKPYEASNTHADNPAFLTDSDADSKQQKLRTDSESSSTAVDDYYKKLDSFRKNLEEKPRSEEKSLDSSDFPPLIHDQGSSTRNSHFTQDTLPDIYDDLKHYQPKRLRRNKDDRQQAYSDMWSKFRNKRLSSRNETNLPKSSSEGDNLNLKQEAEDKIVSSDVDALVSPKYNDRITNPWNEDFDGFKSMHRVGGMMNLNDQMKSEVKSEVADEEDKSTDSSNYEEDENLDKKYEPAKKVVTHDTDDWEPQKVYYT